MKKLLYMLACVLGLGALSCGTKTTKQEPSGFVKVENGEFTLDGKPYKYIGTNFWYGAILGSEGRGGDRARLLRELDSLHALGLDNLRILAGGQGDRHIPSHIEPTLETAPGVYNDTILAGLDFLLSEMEKRGMKGVIYLNNAWEWSGGYGSYLEWAGRGKAPVPSVDGWPAYNDYVKAFVMDTVARRMATDHARFMAGRTNRYTGKPYKDSPAIMSWQVANEPRSFSDEGKPYLKSWIQETARAIKEVDPNHLVSTGSEGKHGCEQDLELWADIHAMPEIDYAIAHLWPYNWGWAHPDSLKQHVTVSCEKAKEYIGLHAAKAKQMKKPLVIEEFGYPRDNMGLAPGSPTEARDAFYDYMCGLVADGTISGLNFWGWGGEAKPKHAVWEPGDDYTGDPAQEDQGLNSIFQADKSTLNVIKKHTANLKNEKTTDNNRSGANLHR